MHAANPSGQIQIQHSAGLKCCTLITDYYFTVVKSLMNNTGDYAIAFFTVVFTAEYSVKGRKAHSLWGVCLGLCHACRSALGSSQVS